jgi:lysine 6-dehydrogenase
MEKALRRQEGDKDQVLVRAKVSGRAGGVSKTYQIDIHDKQDERTGFTAMERMTGFPTAIYAIEIARGNVPPGCWRYELAVPGSVVVSELKKRGIPIHEYEV